MARNIELKARTHHPESQFALAAALADQPETRLVQRDVFFETPKGRLKLRLENQLGTLISYHRPDQSAPKCSVYQLHTTDQPDSLLACLSAALPVRGEVRKSRLLYLHGQTRIHCDTVEGLGQYLELEVVLNEQQDEAEGLAIAKNLAEALNIREEDLEPRAYMDLLLEQNPSTLTQGEPHGA